MARFVFWGKAPLAAWRDVGFGLGKGCTWGVEEGGSCLTPQCHPSTAAARQCRACNDVTLGMYVVLGLLDVLAWFCVPLWDSSGVSGCYGMDSDKRLICKMRATGLLVLFLFQHCMLCSPLSIMSPRHAAETPHGDWHHLVQRYHAVTPVGHSCPDIAASHHRSAEHLLPCAILRRIQSCRRYLDQTTHSIAKPSSALSMSLCAENELLCLTDYEVDDTGRGMCIGFNCVTVRGRPVLVTCASSPALHSLNVARFLGLMCLLVSV